MELEHQLQMNIPQITTRGHAYLEELESADNAFPYSIINPNDERSESWEEERQIYGFDNTETWDLRSSFYAWLYEHLRMYIDTSSEIVNLEFHTFEWHGRKYTQLELINMILERIGFFFCEEYDDFEKSHLDYVSEVEELWALVLPAMWW